MFEGVIFCIILLAAGYWATMFVMGRRDDVIHGKFVHSDEQGEVGQPVMPAPPPFPKRPLTARQAAAETFAKPGDERPRSAPSAKPVNSAALQSLLAAIQQDLKSVPDPSRTF